MNEKGVQIESLKNFSLLPNGKAKKTKDKTLNQKLEAIKRN